jgi:hypothetical protein
LKRRSVNKFLNDEKGSVESSLVLVPLLSLFLIAAQLTVALHSRNMEKISAQDEASNRAISGEFKDSDTYLHIYSADPNQNLDLIVSHRKRTLLQIFPGLSNFTGSDLQTDVSGIAIIENQR